MDCAAGLLEVSLGDPPRHGYSGHHCHRVLRPVPIPLIEAHGDLCDDDVGICFIGHVKFSFAPFSLWRGSLLPLGCEATPRSIDPDRIRISTAVQLAGPPLSRAGSLPQGE